jgi:catechol-2,3-dioxygenase
VKMPIAMTRLILYVRDLACLKSFYPTHFGFPVIEEIDNEWAVLLAGRVELALHLAGQPIRRAAANAGQSNAKLVFSVDSELAELRSRLAMADVPVGEIKRYPGFAYSLCDGRDPGETSFSFPKQIEYRLVALLRLRLRKP